MARPWPWSLFAPSVLEAAMACVAVATVSGVTGAVQRRIDAFAEKYAAVFPVR